jgi:hypothetical protein
MGWGQVVHAQNYVFYFESDIAKVFPFRPTCSSGTCKVRNEIETKRNEIERNEIKRNETDRNETKSNETTLHFVSFRSVSFRFISISFRTLQVPSFDSGFSKNEILELIVFN